MNLLDLLNGNNYGVFNRKIAKEIGLNTSIVLSELIDKFQYFHSNNSLISLKDHDGMWFYLTADSLEDRTTLTEKEQRTCIDKLIDLGFIKKTLSGLPAKRYFQINTLKIFEFFECKINSTNLAPRPNLMLPEVQTSHSSKPTMDPNKNLYIKTKKEKEAPPPPSADASELCKFFIEKIKERNPKFKDPRLREWEKEFQKLLEIDKRDLQETKELIEWVHVNSFWKANCLSPEALRKHYDKMWMQRQAQGEQSTVEDNRGFAINLKKKYQDRLKNLTISPKYAMKLDSGKELPFSLPVETFRNALCNMFGGKYDPNRSSHPTSEVESSSEE